MNGFEYELKSIYESKSKSKESPNINEFKNSIQSTILKFVLTKLRENKTIQKSTHAHTKRETTKFNTNLIIHMNMKHTHKHTREYT